MTSLALMQTSLWRGLNRALVPRERPSMLMPNQAAALHRAPADLIGLQMERANSSQGSMVQ